MDDPEKEKEEEKNMRTRENKRLIALIITGYEVSVSIDGQCTHRPCTGECRNNTYIYYSKCPADPLAKPRSIIIVSKARLMALS